ncbi:DUF4124 domain-containing protein [Pseudomonas gingeri]|uniref:DUF4124 domain-containing protein n=1 Tax=Pseudomonas gingeri TaxID=117681 RepID=A0A7Y7XEA2_9PSED|nr:DUF4124 domain-containing protein [Pseudomonas gingeri]NWA26894.1 DUF4124 domain-containing protein [Pseudomonas gingeri]NWB97990.1 DUF4124 domain-containing protein [Pseudomonas gingeri]NWD70706.1 DUF4124 domain-containing protein [Pseudomonas gingeri]NWD78330.1 DUF4124 domain-containing protein [Pseudomonas gingeri]
MGRCLVLVLLFGVSCSAFSADAYKCVGHDGKVSFAAQPCAPDQGVSTWEARTQRTQLHSVSADEGKADAINQRATKILQAGYHTRIIYKVNIIPSAGQTTP